ncbi:Tc1-mariner class transposase [Mycena venus]|uniref:Tc1-mariner class transposase n=1 Tax=Mycena venus TaxID=2733690 RepID=A0A8H7DF47_9AGAR|nr:Tc1-mariner class transposase [Mycena venus]
MYLDELQEKMLTQRGVDVSIATLLRTLRRLHFSRKCVSPRALQRNDTLRSAYWIRIADLVPDPNMLMFIDEAAKNDHTTTRQKGWSLMGMRCIQRRAFVRGKRFSILSVLTLDGIIAHDVIEGSVNTQRFIGFLEEHVQRGNHGSDDDEDPELYDANGLSDLERELVQFRGKLEKRYQNDHNAGYTYIDPKTGNSYPLTPQMMKEWCRAMYNGEATLNEAPNFITNFDPANRQVALHPTRIAAGANRPAGVGPPQGLSDIGHLATILMAVMGHGGQSGVANVVAS